jgi:acyl carrier protein
MVNFRATKAQNENRDSMDDPRAGRILDLIAKETFVDRDKLVPDATMEELGIASLDVVQTMFAIEEEYDIEIPVAGQGGGLEFATVKSLIDHVILTLDKVAVSREAPLAGAVASR